MAPLVKARKPGQRYRCCASGRRISSEIVDWSKARRQYGHLAISLHGLWENTLGPKWLVSFTSVRGHTLRCLRLDPVTGEKRR